MRLEGNGLTRQGERVDVLAVVGASHVRLAETDGVFALGDIVEDFEVFLRDTLWAGQKPRQRVNRGCRRELRAHSVGEVHLHSQDTNILRAGLGGVDGRAVGVDTVGSGHFGREIERVVGRKLDGGGEDKEGGKLVARFYSPPALRPIFRIVPFKNRRPINRTLKQTSNFLIVLVLFFCCA